MKTLLFTILVFAATPAISQHQAHHTAQAVSQPSTGNSPYVGMQNRTIKALSEEQTADLRTGKGMSLALPAELNGYPGPAHVLELASVLGLSDDQEAKTQSLYEQMQGETKVWGERVIASEYELDRLFRQRTASPVSVQEATETAATIHGQLRAAHLRYHLSMMDVLTPSQVALYYKLRGYR